MTYPGGKSGAGVYQRLINLIPPHETLIVPFAGHCGIVRNIRPAARTIVIDLDERVCDWWDRWRRSREGRNIEIHLANGIDWLRHHTGATEYCAAESCDSAAPPVWPSTFVFADPPYVMVARRGGAIYRHELGDDSHSQLVEMVARLSPKRFGVMLCGLKNAIYTERLPAWYLLEHRVPTRRGLQAECVWMNYARPTRLHDYRYVGNSRRSRERIRRRQKTWREQLQKMPPLERLAMLESLKGVGDG